MTGALRTGAKGCPTMTEPQARVLYAFERFRVDPHQ